MTTCGISCQRQSFHGQAGSKDQRDGWGAPPGRPETPRIGGRPGGARHAPSAPVPPAAAGGGVSSPTTRSWEARSSARISPRSPRSSSLRARSRLRASVRSSTRAARAARSSPGPVPEPSQRCSRGVFQTVPLGRPRPVPREGAVQFGGVDPPAPVVPAGARDGAVPQGAVDGALAASRRLGGLSQGEFHGRPVASQRDVPERPTWDGAG